MPRCQTSPGLICVTHFSRRRGIDGDDGAAILACRAAGRPAVGRRGALLVSVPKKMVLVAASNDGVPQTVLVAGPKWKTCSPQASLIVIGGSSGSGFGPDVVLPRDLAGLRLEGHDEPATRAALVDRWSRATTARTRRRANDDLAVGEDRRGERAVERVRVGEALGARIDLPLFLARLPIEGVQKPRQIREVDGVIGHQGGAINARSLHRPPSARPVRSSSRPPAARAASV